jgi:hypothetical protein
MQRPRSLSSLAITRLVAVLALTAAAFGVSNAFAGGPTATIGSLSLGLGQQGTVSLRALGLSGSGLGAWTVDISYDPSVVSIDACHAQHGGLCNPAYGPSTIRTNGVQVHGLTGDVTLATIDITCDSVGASSLSITLTVFADSTTGGPQPINAGTSNGSVQCAELPTPTPTPENPGLDGDVDCDHDVDSIDAALVLQYDAALIHSLACFANGDMNHDGRVNSIDGSIILQMAAGLI